MRMKKTIDGLQVQIFLKTTRKAPFKILKKMSNVNVLTRKIKQLVKTELGDLFKVEVDWYDLQTGSHRSGIDLPPFKIREVNRRGK